MPSPKHILIVEDNKPMATTLEAKLGQSGFDTTVATDGAQALALIDKQSFDLIILDLILPKITGFEVLEALEKRKNTTPVIVSTDLGQEDDCIKALSLGAKDYFVKADTSVADITRYVKAFLADPTAITTHRAYQSKGTALARHVRTTLANATLRAYLQEIEPLKKGFDLLNDHVIITDAHANILYANKAVERNTGFTIKEMLGHNPADLWGGQMPREFYDQMWHTIKMDKKPFVAEVKNVTKDGQEYWQELHIAPVLDSTGEVRFFIGIEPNITDRKEKERFRDEFMSILGHQLKDPLTAIRWSLELLTSSKACGPKERQMLEQMYAENQSLMNLITDVLLLSKLDANGRKGGAVDLAALLEKIVTDVGKKFPNVALSFNTSATDCTVHGQTAMIEQLFVNIIGNAAKYAPEKKGRVEVKIARQDNGHIVSCHDNGIGIPEAEQAHIFERFFRASNAKATEPTGTGLGLFIAKLIADSYEWQLSFTSAVGTGTEFRVVIPLFNKAEKIYNK